MNHRIFRAASSFGSASSAALLLGAVLALAPAVVVTASAGERVDSAAPSRATAPAHGARRHDRYPGHVYDRGPGVEVYINPETEHAPSNYVPDNYRLEDYDGRPDRPTLCRGESGTTLSTTRTPCPDGQRPSSGTRTLSTSP